MKPGIHTISETAYHADPCPAPSLSSSIAKILLAQTPRHAWMAHPRLNPNFEPETSSEFDIGSAAHALLVGAGRDIVAVEADSWRSSAAKEARDRARADGKIPLLPSQYTNVVAMAAAAQAQLAHHESRAFLDAANLSERALIWQEGKTWFRARPDRMRADGKIIWDYKTTTNAHPDAFARKIYDMGYDMRAEFYCRGLARVLGTEAPAFHFIVQEKEPPYALSVVALTPGANGMADRKVETAIRIWRECVEANSWPGYPSCICHVDAPGYSEKSWLDREAREEVTPFRIKQMIEWQGPLKGDSA